jgi:hypothetical protein
MMDIKVWLILASIVFNAGGFVYVVFNHLKHIAKRLDEIERRLAKVELNFARHNG